jgi:hypothetical protein
MALPLVIVVSVPLLMIEVPWNRLKAQKNKRGSKRLGIQFCHGSVGGDGKRLLPLMRKMASKDRPKQFCAVLGSETLFVQDSEFIAFPILQGGRCVTIH